MRAANPERLNAVLEQSRAVLRRSAPQLAIREMTTMDAVFDEAVGPAGQLATLLSLLAALALVLDAVGVYGMISHYVGRRTREYGIRIAMGWRPARAVGSSVEAPRSSPMERDRTRATLAMDGVAVVVAYTASTGRSWASPRVGHDSSSADGAFVPAWRASDGSVIVMRKQ